MRSCRTGQRWGRFLLLIELILAFSMAGIAASAETVLHRGNSGEPETLDPHKSSGVWEANIQRDLFEGLLAEAADGELIPGMAKRWEVSADGLIYTFHLREDAKWSNSEPVTADDFVFAMRRLLNPLTAAKYASILYPIENAEAINTSRIQDLDALGVRALDERTLQITLKAPTPYFLQQLVHPTAYPVPRAIVEKYGDGWVKPGVMLSNGAYRLVEWVPQAHVKLVKNGYFHDADKVRIDTVYFYPTENRSAALKRFRAGELDINDDAPADQIEWIRANLAGEFRVAPYLGVYYYALNTRHKPFDDVRVRRALSMAILREIIVDKITGAGEVAAYSFVPPGTGNYFGGPAYADFKDWPLAKRRAEALRLIREAGFSPDNPLKLTLKYNTSENHKKLAVAVAAMWKKLGVETTLFNSDAKVHYNSLEEGDFQVARAAWIADYDDPQNFLFLLESNNTDLNYAGYSNLQYDRLMAEASVTADLEARANLLRRAEAIIMRDMPYIPIYYYVSKNLVKRYIKGWEDNVKNVHPTRFLWIEK